MKRSNYTVYHEFDADDCLVWHVYETATDQVISSFFFNDDAHNYANFLETGGAFAGYTPSFVLKKTHSVDINDAFTAEFSE